MKRSGPLRRITPLTPSPKKRWKPRHNAELARSVKVVKQRSGGLCEAGVEEVCTGHGQHRHHVILRSRGGSDLPENLLDVCSNCHWWIHHHVAEATKRGLMRSRWDASRDGH